MGGKTPFSLKHGIVITKVLLKALCTEYTTVKGNRQQHAANTWGCPCGWFWLWCLALTRHYPSHTSSLYPSVLHCHEHCTTSQLQKQKNKPITQSPDFQIHKNKSNYMYDNHFSSKCKHPISLYDRYHQRGRVASCRGWTTWPSGHRRNRPVSAGSASPSAAPPSSGTDFWENHPAN